MSYGRSMGVGWQCYCSLVIVMVVVCGRCLSSFFSSFSSLLFVVGVRGSARAALRARTLSPNTIVFLAPYCSLLLFLPPPPFFFLRLSIVRSGGVRLPCITVFGGHDGDGESVSFVFVFLVVAGSAFSVSAVAASAVAFGA